jgi:nucleoside 2-deoxyribosyltransferase
MKFYIASSFDYKEEVKKIVQFLKEHSHSITTDWTNHKPLKPYSKNKELSKEYVIEDIKGVEECDVFILLSDKKGSGMYIELGVAMELKKNIFVVGKQNESSMFFFHPLIKRRTSIDEVFKELKII